MEKLDEKLIFSLPFSAQQVQITVDSEMCV